MVKNRKYWSIPPMPENKPKTLIIYHQACTDGVVAAWAVWRFQEDKSLVELHGAKHGDAPPDVKDKHVVIVDFCYPRATLIEMASRVASLTVLDHHKTAKADLDLDSLIVAQDPNFRNAVKLEIIFDMDRSGAGIAWDWAARKEHETHQITSSCVIESRPWLVNYVEDRDLWRHKLPHTKAISAFLNTIDISDPIKAFERFEQIYDHPANFLTYAGLGEMLLERDTKELARHLKWAYETDLAGHKVLAVNATILNSELANKLSEGRAFGVAWSMTEDGRYRYSLRSTGGFDTTEVAKLWGGGGHAAASGFSSDYLLCVKVK